MTKIQTIIVGSAVVLFLGLYFGFSIVPRERAMINQNRALNAQSTDIPSLIRTAKTLVSEDDIHSIGFIEKEVNEAKTDSSKIVSFKKLSGAWYQAKQYALAGVYAEKIAEIENTAEAWSITGTTFSIGIQKSEQEEAKLFCRDKAVSAFEKAISLEPQKVDHQTNLALSYVELPLQNNPMKGVLMLIDLAKDNPKNVAILNNLGRLAIKTGQYEKAVERLENAIAVEPDNQYTLSLLIQATSESGLIDKATLYNKQLEKIRSSN